jgi:hypothetical protein
MSGAFKKQVGDEPGGPITRFKTQPQKVPMTAPLANFAIKQAPSMTKSTLRATPKNLTLLLFQTRNKRRSTSSVGWVSEALPIDLGSLSFVIKIVSRKNDV